MHYKYGGFRGKNWTPLRPYIPWMRERISGKIYIPFPRLYIREVASPSQQLLFRSSKLGKARIVMWKHSLDLLAMSSPLNTMVKKTIVRTCRASGNFVTKLLDLSISYYIYIYIYIFNIYHMYEFVPLCWQYISDRKLHWIVFLRKDYGTLC